MSQGEPVLRVIGGDGGAGPVRPVGERWALLVGISRYAEPGLDLKFAARDATALHALLCTPEGGGFAPERTQLLVDERATTREITRLLRGSFLMQARPEDLVLVFLACHGGPDPRRPSGPLYFMTHDTDPRDVAGTALPMDELDRVLHASVQAERVLILADTCHSAGVGGGPGIRGAPTAEATNRFLEAMAAAKPGIALLTSAEASEAAQEDERWGGGHGVFTHFLLEGMRGEADGFRGDKDGIVSLGELFEYVRERVREETGGQQHPAIGTTTFDRNLPVAVTADLDVDRHLALARSLIDVGWTLDDPAPFLLAAAELAAASDLRRGLPVADAQRGHALLAAGDGAGAARALAGAVAADPDGVPPERYLELGVARAAIGDPAATEAFAEYLRRAPGGPFARWAAAHRDHLASAGQVRALVVGIGSFDDASLPPLPGVANDVELMAGTLRGLGIADVVERRDATRAELLAALERLGTGGSPSDVDVVYFAGHADVGRGPDEPYLVTREGADGGSVVGVTPRQLVAALDRVPGAAVLVLDTHATSALVDLLDGRPHITTLLAGDVGELSVEATVDGRQHGAFTAALCGVLAATPPPSYGALLDATRPVVSAVASGRQTPVLLGRPSDPPFRAPFPDGDLWRLAHVRRPPRPGDLERAAGRVELGGPRLAWTVGRWLIGEGRVREAAERLEAARAGLGDDPLLLIDLARACLETDPRRAAAAMAAARAVATRGQAAAMEEAEACLARAPAAVPAVVVVGADPPGSRLGITELVPEVVAAVAAATGVAPVDVVRLAGRDAGRDAVLTAVRTLASVAADRLALLVFIGIVREGALVVADGVIGTDELRRAVGGSENLVVLADVDATLADLAERGVVGRPVEPAIDGVPHMGAVAVTLFGSPAVGPTLHGAGFDRRRPLFARLPALAEAQRVGASYAAWAGEGPLVHVAGPGAGLAVLRDRSPALTARRHLEEAAAAGPGETVRLARQAIDRRAAHGEDHPLGYLQVGLALDATGRTDEAVAALRAARNMYDDLSIFTSERAGDPGAPRWRREARFHLGRLLAGDGRDLEGAVASLRQALDDDPDDARVRYELGRALYALAERGLLVEAAAHLRRYLDLGAPYGRAGEVRSFVRGRAER